MFDWVNLSPVSFSSLYAPSIVTTHHLIRDCPRFIFVYFSKLLAPVGRHCFHCCTTVLPIWETYKPQNMYPTDKPVSIPRTRRGVWSSSFSFAASKNSSTFTLLLVVFALLVGLPTSQIRPVEGRKHHLVLQYDFRRLFPISTFGYFPGGSLNVTVTKFKFHLNSNALLDQASVSSDSDYIF